MLQSRASLTMPPCRRHNVALIDLSSCCTTCSVDVAIAITDNGFRCSLATTPGSTPGLDLQHQRGSVLDVFYVFVLLFHYKGSTCDLKVTCRN